MRKRNLIVILGILILVALYLTTTNLLWMSKKKDVLAYVIDDLAMNAVNQNSDLDKINIEFENVNIKTDDSEIDTILSYLNEDSNLLFVEGRYQQVKKDCYSSTVAFSMIRRFRTKCLLNVSVEGSNIDFIMYEYKVSFRGNIEIVERKEIVQ